MPVQDMYEEAAKLSLKINAPCYNILLFSLQEKRTAEDRGTDRIAPRAYSKSS